MVKIKPSATACFRFMNRTRHLLDINELVN